MIQRAVFLGASNLRLGLDSLCSVLDPQAQPIELLAACGHGRSYGIPSRFVGKLYAPLSASPLWQELASRPPRPTRALLCDIGNDLVYGVPWQQVCAWVLELADRLEGANNRISLSALPLGSLERLSPSAFHAARWLFFRGRPLDRARLLDDARHLDACLAHAAAERGYQWMAAPPERFGWDAIHYRWWARRSIWKELAEELGWPTRGTQERASAALDLWVDA